MKSRKTSRISMTSDAREMSGRNQTSTPFQIGKLQPATTAHMVFDSSLSLLPHGVRGRDQHRHLLFTAPDLDIHLKIAARDRHKEIYGQVIPRNSTEPSIIVVLVTEEESNQVKRPNHCGEFSFSDVPAGDVAIKIILPSRTVVAAFDA
jgi:hypothetical protein